MIDQASDIVSILAETDLTPRRERAAFVAKLRNKHRMKYRQIGKQLNVSAQRAHQLYQLHGVFNEADDDIEF